MGALVSFLVGIAATVAGGFLGYVAHRAVERTRRRAASRRTRVYADQGYPDHDVQVRNLLGQMAVVPFSQALELERDPGYVRKNLPVERPPTAKEIDNLWRMVNEEPVDHSPDAIRGRMGLPPLLRPQGAPVFKEDPDA